MNEKLDIIIAKLEELKRSQEFRSETFHEIIKDEIAQHKEACRKGDLLETIKQLIRLAKTSPITASVLTLILGILVYLGMQ